MNKLRIALPYVAILLGVITIAAGIFAIVQGRTAKDEVRDKLGAQNITLTDDAAAIVPGAEPGAASTIPSRLKPWRRSSTLTPSRRPAG